MDSRTEIRGPVHAKIGTLLKSGRWWMGVKRFAMGKPDRRDTSSVPVPSDGRQTGGWQFWETARSSDGGLDGINKSAGLVVRVGARDRIDSGRASDSEIRHRGPANLSGTVWLYFVGCG